GINAQFFINCWKQLRQNGCVMADTWKSQSKDFMIQNNCTKACQQPSCSEVIINSRIISGSGRRIFIYAPFTPVISTVATAQVSLISYLTNIGSSLGFWLGLSAVATAQSIIRYSRSLFRRIRFKGRKEVRKRPCCVLVQQN